jgi:hypothetical protein
MVISDSVEKLLGVEGAAQEERKVTVCGFDDIGNLVDCLTPIKGVLIREPILDDVSEHDAGTQRLGHTRKEGGIDNRRTTGIRHMPILGLRGAGTKTGSGCRRGNRLINKGRTHVCRGGGR